MNRLVNFLMVGLAFTVLQISTVAAQAPGAPVLTIGDPACAVPPAIGCPPGSPGLMSAPGTMPPPTMTPPPGAPHMPPMGDHSGMSNLGAHCGNIQAKNEKKRMTEEVKCLRRALHEHKPTVKLRQSEDGVGRYGCSVKKTGSKPAQIACLRGLLDAPSGTPGMPPTMAPGTMPPPTMAPPMGDHSGMPPMTPPPGAPHMPPMGDHSGMPPGSMPPPTMAPPMGDHSGIMPPTMTPPPGAPHMPPMGDHSGMPPMGEPMCFDPAKGQIPCSQMPGANPNMAPPVSTMPPMGDHSGMPPMPPPMMAPPGTMPPPMMAPPTGAPGMHGDTAALRACKQIRPKGKLGKMRKKKNCFRNLAKSLGANKSVRAEWKRCKQIRPKGKLGKMRNKKNCFRDLARSVQHGPPTGAPGMPPMMAPPMGDPNMPPPTMAPPMGAPGMAHLGDHCGAIQAKNAKKKMRKEVKCLRRALHEHKPTVKLRQTKDGLGAYGCGVRKTGSKTAQIACLRGLLDAPSGTPGMAPMMAPPGGMAPPTGAPGKKGKLGNYGCGNKDRLKHVNCLRDLLGTTSQFGKVKHRKEGNKTRGLYGCSGLKKGNWQKHTKCLRRLLDKHGPHLAKGGKRGMAPGTR